MNVMTFPITRWVSLLIRPNKFAMMAPRCGETVGLS